MAISKFTSQDMTGGNKEKRDSERTACFIPVDYSAQDRIHKDFIQNISSSGVFIESRKIMEVGARILMTFDWLKNHPVKSKGTIVRSSKLGFGVKFDSPVTLYSEAAVVA